MTSMSHDAAVAAIGAQLIEAGTRALAAGASTVPTVTALPPAGAEEVSAQAAAAFAAEAETTLAVNTAAQQELMRAGAALMQIASMYEQADVAAAGTLVTSGNQFTTEAFAAVSHTGAGLAEAEVAPAPLLGAGAAAPAPAAPTSAITNLIQGATAVGAGASVSLPAAVGAASTAASVVSAPLGSISSFASMGGAAGSGAAAVPASLAGDEQGTGQDPQGADGQKTEGQQPGEQLL